MLLHLHRRHARHLLQLRRQRRETGLGPQRVGGHSGEEEADCEEDGEYSCGEGGVEGEGEGGIGVGVVSWCVYMWGLKGRAREVAFMRVLIACFEEKRWS